MWTCCKICKSTRSEYSLNSTEILLSGTNEDKYCTIEEKNPTEKTNSKFPSSISSAPPIPAINSRVKAFASQISSSLVFPSQSGNEPEETLDESDPYSRQDRRHSRFKDNDDDGLNPDYGDEYQAIEKKQGAGVMEDEYQALSLNENSTSFYSESNIQ